MWRYATLAVLVVPVVLAGPPNEPERFVGAAVEFTATLAKATEGAMALSQPPIRNYHLEFTNVRVTRGTLPPGVKTEATYGVQSMNPPIFAEGRRCQVAARIVGDQVRVVGMSPGPFIPPDDDARPSPRGLTPDQWERIRDEIERRRLPNPDQR